MVVHIFEWEWNFEMRVVEMDGRDNMELGMEDIEENIEDFVDFSQKVLANPVANIGFGVEMAKVAKEGVFPN